MLSNGKSTGHRWDCRWIATRITPATKRCWRGSINNPSQLIIAHDSYEAYLECDGDIYAPTGTNTVNLTQHRGSAARLTEYWRHNDAANVLWADGHVKVQVRTDSIPLALYTP